MMKRFTSTSVLISGASVLLSLAGACEPKSDEPWRSEDDVGLDEGGGDDAGEGEDEGGGTAGDECGEDEGGGTEGEEPDACLPSDPCADAEGTGHLEGFKCDLDVQWADQMGISCEDALAECEAHAAAYPEYSYLCDWNGTQIFANELDEGTCDAYGPVLEPCDEPPPPCDPADPCAGTEGQAALYYFDLCGMDGGTGLTAGISCQDALDNCILNDVSNPALGIYCEWDGQEIYRNDLGAGICVPEYGEPPSCEDPAPVCELDEPCAGAGGFLGVGVAYPGCDPGTFVDMLGPGDALLSCEQVLAECDALIAANPGTSVFCSWNDLALRLTEAVPGECSDFDPC